MAFSAEFWDFLGKRKKYWLLPIPLVILLLGLMLLLAEDSVIEPFIYALF